MDGKCFVKNQQKHEKRTFSSCEGAKKMVEFGKMMEEFIESVDSLELSELFKKVINESGALATFKSAIPTLTTPINSLDNIQESSHNFLLLR